MHVNKHGMNAKLMHIKFDGNTDYDTTAAPPSRFLFQLKPIHPGNFFQLLSIDPGNQNYIKKEMLLLYIHFSRTCIPRLQFC